MNYISTRKNNESVPFKSAILNGLTENGGLYLPEKIPTLAPSFFQSIDQLDQNEIAFQVLNPYTQGVLPDLVLRKIIKETLQFPMPVIPVNKTTFSLELYHGPTKAFKDIGARFMSRCLSFLTAESSEKTTVLVATSGDTGSAVANGFYDLPNIAVKILFPKGKVSPYQEYQMTHLGKNIEAIEVSGTFDDCQNLIKQAFQDSDLKSNLILSSANSINIARLLPQMLYYFFAYQQLKPLLDSKKLVLSIPSGNLGNLTAGLMAKKMGLPIHQFIASHNENNPFKKYLNTGKFEAMHSTLTYSSAMDVGNPSNFERILTLYGNDLELIKEDVSAFSFSDRETLQEMKNCFTDHNYLLDPHSAVGKLGLEKGIKANQLGVFVATAHPQKFAEIIQKFQPNYTSPKVDLQQCKKTKILNTYDLFKTYLLHGAKSTITTAH